MPNAREHFEAGRLAEAVTVMNEEVRANPRDADRRGFLAELLCLTGNLERADLQLDAIGQQDPKLALGVALSRQLIRGEQARRQFFSDGRMPEVIGEPTERLRLFIEASVRLREGAVAEAADVLTRLEAARAPLAGIHNDQPFDDFRDLDDLIAGVFEVVTSVGKYYVIPMERVAFVEFHAPERPRDLMWRRALMNVIDGPEGEVFIPVSYVPPGIQPPPTVSDAARLGRITDWVGGEGEPIRGIGQRSFILGEESIGILELGRIDFTPAGT
jgi:type VI secretion system protein ImpE